jgi:hypothetical protein
LDVKLRIGQCSARCYSLTKTRALTQPKHTRKHCHEANVARAHDHEQPDWQPHVGADSILTLGQMVVGNKNKGKHLMFFAQSIFI